MLAYQITNVSRIEVQIFYAIHAIQISREYVNFFRNAKKLQVLANARVV